MLPAPDFLFPHLSKHSLILSSPWACPSHIFSSKSHSSDFSWTKVVCRKRYQMFLQFSPENTPLFGLPTFLGFLIDTSCFYSAPSWGDIWCHSFSVTWWMIKQYQSKTSFLLLRLLVFPSGLSKCAAIFGSNDSTPCLSPDSSQFLQEGDIVPRRSRSAINCRHCNWPQSSDGIVRIPYELDPTYGGFNFFKMDFVQYREKLTMSEHTNSWINKF